MLVSQINRLNFWNDKANKYYILFIFTVILSTVINAYEKGIVTGRNFSQLLFTFQYFILIVDLGIETEKIYKKIYFFGLIEALYLVVSFLLLRGVPISFLSLFTIDKNWGYGVIPNFPNGIVPSLLIVLFFSGKYRRRLIEITIIIGALLVTTSRAALVGIILILSYWVMGKINRQRNKLLSLKLLIIVLSLVLIIIIIAIPSEINNRNSELEKILLRTYDRIFLFNLFFEYFSQNPIFGYGGNTLDQISLNDNYILPVAHTHNTIFELLIRYGVLGTIPFLLLLISLYRKIDDPDMKFLFLLLLFLSLFQVFIRDFNFLFFLYVLSIGKQHYPMRGNNE